MKLVARFVVLMGTTPYCTYRMSNHIGTEPRVETRTWYRELTPILGISVLYQHGKGTGFGTEVANLSK